MRKGMSALVPVLVLALALSGCSTTPPDQVVTRFLDAVKAVDAEEIAKCVVQEGGSKIDSTLQPDDPVGAETLKVVFGRLTYEVDKATITGDTATVPVSITCVDMANVVAGVMSKAMGLAFAAAFGGEQSEDEMQAMFEEMFVNALKDLNAPMTTKSITLSLKKTQGKWLVVLDDQSSIDFMNAITGGLGNLAEAFGDFGE